MLSYAITRPGSYCSESMMDCLRYHVRRTTVHLPLICAACESPQHLAILCRPVRRQTTALRLSRSSTRACSGTPTDSITSWNIWRKASAPILATTASRRNRESILATTLGRWRKQAWVLKNSSEPRRRWRATLVGAFQNASLELRR
jgi:hypothetical protein